MSKTRTYLGDAVYADIAHLDGIELFTSDGLRRTNTIILEARVIEALIQFLTRNEYIKKEKK